MPWPLKHLDIFQEKTEEIAEHGLRLACDATHDISNSKVKLFALGWLAQHVESHMIRNTFVLLAFAVAVSESSLATKFLLESAESFLKDKCGDTLKNAKADHLDGGTGLVKGFQEYFGSALPLVRSLEHVKRNINKEGVKN